MNPRNHVVRSTAFRDSNNIRRAGRYAAVHPAPSLATVNPCGNFSDISGLKFPGLKGSIGHDFSVCIRTENQNQVSFYPFVLHEISVLIELTLGHLRYCLTDVPPQPNSPSDCVFNLDQTQRSLTLEYGLDGRFYPIE
jgi:hypothetical protein